MPGLAIDFVLIRQKDHILTLVNDGKYEEANTLLNYSAELWAECSYTYKFLEIKDRIRRAILEEVNTSTHWKTEAKWRDMLEKVS
jgi:hypothetical protein